MILWEIGENVKTNASSHNVTGRGTKLCIFPKAEGEIKTRTADYKFSGCFPMKAGNDIDL